MACINCQNNNQVNYICTTPACPNCSCTNTTPTGPCGEDTTDSSKIVYSGPALQCLDLPTKSTVDEIIQAVDSMICSSIGIDYSSFDIGSCIVNEDLSQITTVQEFAEAISKYVCEFHGDYNTFVTNVYNTFVTNITQQLEAATVSGITGTCTGLVPSDDLSQSLTKIDNKICQINTNVNAVNGANWNLYGYTVTAPTTPLAATNEILFRIGQLKASIVTPVVLPTFNNVGSCLPGTLTTTDSLATTVDKLKTKVCSFGTVYNYATLTYGCVTSAANSFDALQNTINRVNAMSIYTFNPTYFTLTDTDGGNPCAGKTVTLNPSGIDRKVSSNSADTTPGYLDAKLQAGTGISLDFATTPGKAIISSSAITGDHKVMVNGSDVVPDYLDTKIDGATDTTGSLTLVASSNVGNTKVIITPAIDFDSLTDEVLTRFENDSSFMLRLCALLSDCPSSTPPRTVSYRLTASDKNIRVVSGQQTPTLAFYDSGNVLVNPTVNSGAYTLTFTGPNPVVNFSITNTSGASYTVHIYVVNSVGAVVTGSDDIVQVLAAGANFGTAINLGTSTGTYLVRVDFA